MRSAASGFLQVLSMATFGPLDCRLPHHAVDVVTVACWCMLRASEMADARIRDLTPSSATFGGGISLDMPPQKTAQGGRVRYGTTPEHQQTSGGT